MPEWLLVDGSSMFFRAFYAIPQTMRGPGGVLVNAETGLNMAGKTTVLMWCLWPAGLAKRKIYLL